MSARTRLPFQIERKCNNIRTHGHAHMHMETHSTNKYHLSLRLMRGAGGLGVALGGWVLYLHHTHAAHIDSAWGGVWFGVRSLSIVMATVHTHTILPHTISLCFSLSLCFLSDGRWSSLSAVQRRAVGGECAKHSENMQRPTPYRRWLDCNVALVVFPTNCTTYVYGQEQQLYCFAAKQVNAKRNGWGWDTTRHTWPAYRAEEL